MKNKIKTPAPAKAECGSFLLKEFQMKRSVVLVMSYLKFRKALRIIV